MTAEERVLATLENARDGSRLRDACVDLLVQFFRDAYAVIGQNVPRKTRLERIEFLRIALSVKLCDVIDDHREIPLESPGESDASAL